MTEPRWITEWRVRNLEERLRENQRKIEQDRLISQHRDKEAGRRIVRLLRHIHLINGVAE